MPLHPNGVGALLGEGDVIEEEETFGAGERLGQALAVSSEDGALVPGL